MPMCGICGYSVVRLDSFFDELYNTNSSPLNKNSVGIQNFEYKKLHFPAISSNFFLNFHYNKNKNNIIIHYNETCNKFEDNKYYQRNNIINPHTKEGEINLNSKNNRFKNKIHQKTKYLNINNHKVNYKSKRKENNYKINVKFKQWTKDDLEFSQTIFFENYNISKNIKPREFFNESIDDFITKDEPEERNYVFETEFTRYSFSLVITIIQITIITVQIIFHYHFVSESPYFNRTIFSMWDCKVFISYIFMNGIGQFFSQLLTILPQWCRIVYHFVILFFDIYFLYYTFFQPFVKIGMNSFFQSLYTYNFMYNAVLFAWEIKKSKILTGMSISTFILIIPFFIVYYFINKKIINNINEKLTPPEIPFDEQDDDDDDDEKKESYDINSKKYWKKLSKMQKKKKKYYELTDHEKREIFDNFVFQSVDHAYLYFRVGISRSSPFFIDFSFIRYMKDVYGQNEIQLFILKLMSLFPSQLQLFSTWLSILSKKEDVLSVCQQCMMYQLHRINNSRQSSFSKEIQKELMILDNLSDDAISAIRSFWAEVIQSSNQFKMPALVFIRKKTLNTKTCYIDSIEKYPNSIQILNSYCRFLVESCGDYVECARIGQRIRLIEQGKFINADNCFRSFVNVFPQYLKNRIINEKGSFIVEASESMSSQSSSSISSGQISASFDNIVTDLQHVNLDQINNVAINYNSKGTKDDFQQLIEQENYETLIETLYNNAKARLSIQQIVNQSKSNALISSLIVSIFQCIFFLCIVVLEFSFISQYMSPIQLIASSTRTSRIIFSLQYCSLIAGVQYLSEAYQTNISTKIIEFMKIKEKDLPNFPCTFINPTMSFNEMSQVIFRNIDDEMKFLVSNTKNHINEIKMYNGLNTSITYDTHNNNFTDEESIIQDSLWVNGVFIYKFKDKNYSIYKMPLRNSLEYFRAVVDRLSYEIVAYRNVVNKSNHDEIISDFNDIYFELLLNGLSISEPFFHLFKIISENGIRLIDENEKNMTIMASVFLVLALVIFIIARIICFLKIKKFLATIINIVNKMKVEDIIESMKPIFLKTNKKIKIHSGSNRSIYDTSSVIHYYPIVTIFAIINVLSVFSITVFQIKSSFTFIRNAQQWEKDGASRFLYFIKMINIAIAEHLNIPNFTISEKLKFTSKELLNLSQTLDLSIIGRGKDLNQYYFMINDNSKKNSRQTENKGDNSNKKNLNKKMHFYAKSLKKNESDQQKNTKKMKCTDLDNSNILTRMNLATYLDCVSIESKINLGILYYRLMEITLKDDNLVESPEFITSLFILDKYLYRDLPGFQDKISETTIDEVNHKKRNVYMIGCLGIIIFLIFSLIEFFIIKRVFYSFVAFKQLVLVLPPAAFSNNPFLVNFLTNSCSVFGNSKFAKKINVHGDYLTEEEILLNAVDSGVIIADKNLIIQLVNPAVLKLTGFPSDQLLGQNLQYIIPHTSKHEEMNVSLEKFPFYQRLDEIMSSNGNRSSELNAKILTDKGNEILVRATIIGIFDEKEKGKNGESNDFTCASIILKDISRERELKKKLKETKRQNETLLNFLLPQPVLEKMRASKIPVLYQSNNVALINIEICGLDEYIGTIGPKTLMSNLQFIFSMIDQICPYDSSFDHELFYKKEKKDNDAFKSILQETKNNFYFNLNSVDDDYENAKNLEKNNKMINTKSSKIYYEEIDEIVDDDEFCDFNCIYNIRNYNDQIISISGLFDAENDQKKQAETCLRYAFKVKNIIKNIELEDQVNLLFHAKIAVCMGGPVSGFVDDPDVPKFQIYGDLMEESERIKNSCELDSICINEELYNNIIKENYEIEEKYVPRINVSSKKNEDKIIFEKIYVVNKCFKVKKKNSKENNVFTIYSDSEN